MTKLLTIVETAEPLSLSKSCVYRMVDAGELPVVRVGLGRGRLRVDPVDLETYKQVFKTEAKPGWTRKPLPRPARLEHLTPPPSAD